MSKIVKNGIIAFTMLCVVVLVVFLVELLVINSENEEGGEPEPTHTSGTPANGGDATDPGQTNSQGTGQQGGESQGTDQDGQNDTRPEPEGTRRELAISAGMKLVVYSDDEMFEFSEPESEDIRGEFTFRGSGTAKLEIINIYMPQGVSAFATSFLSVNYEVDGSVNHGEQPIGKSHLSGLEVAGEKDGITYEAWILVFPDAEIEGTGLAIVASYQTSNEMNELNLYEIMDSLDIIMPVT